MLPVHSYVINGVPLQTGDIVCTTNGQREILVGEFWWFIGRLLPGDVDHIAVYAGPEGRCVEAGARGVITFDVPEGVWDGGKMLKQRSFIDTFYGVAYPLQGRGFSSEAEHMLRASVGEYCLAQAAARKPYNLNFFDPLSEDAFYCSQLAYRAYLPHGIDLNTGRGVPNARGTDRIVFPQEIWEGCAHRRANGI